MKKLLILAIAATLALPSAALAARGGVKGKPTVAPTTTTTTTTAAPTTTLPCTDPLDSCYQYCLDVCQPSEWTPIEGYECQWLKAECLADDGTGQPNCLWITIRPSDCQTPD